MYRVRLQRIKPYHNYNKIKVSFNQPSHHSWFQLFPIHSPLLAKYRPGEEEVEEILEEEDLCHILSNHQMHATIVDSVVILLVSATGQEETSEETLEETQEEIPEEDFGVNQDHQRDR